MKTMHTLSGKISTNVFIFLILVCNINLLVGEPPSWSLFLFDNVVQGQWWRVITHPFTHVSLYHLAVDLLATSILFSQLRSSSTVSRPLLFTICSLASLLAVVLFSPHLLTSGYCGLSGTAHGLMSFLGMQWLTDAFTKKERAVPLLTGLLFLLSSAGKSVIEVVTGQVVFSSLHMGELGVPLVHAHLGGAVGGIILFLFLYRKTLSKTRLKSQTTLQNRYISSPCGDQGR